MAEDPRTNIVGITLILIASIIIASMMFLSGCTYSVTQVLTDGAATDVVDEINKTDADVTPTVNVPVTPNL